MFTRLLNALYRIPENVTVRDYRHFYIGRIAFGSSILFHAALLVSFAVLHVSGLVVFSVLSILIYLFCLYLTNQQRYSEAMAIAIVEMLCHQMLAVVWLGWDSGFQFQIILALLLPFLIKEGIGGLKLLLTAVGMLTWIILDMSFNSASALVKIPPIMTDIYYWSNVAVLFSSIVLWSYIFNREVDVFEDQLEFEHGRSQDLLMHILPESIASRLKSGTGSIADEFENTTVLFSDFVGFTQLSSKMKPEQLVKMLNGIFSRFDDLTDRHGLEKIKTIGDAYMVAAGIPENREFHAEVIADFALEMLNVLDQFNRDYGTKLVIRIGINSGRVVAGVIGKKKFIYDLWGDTVNIASRMESHGVPGEIQVSRATFELLSHKYRLAPRGVIEIKGKGEMMTYLLKGRREDLKKPMEPGRYLVDVK